MPRRPRNGAGANFKQLGLTVPMQPPLVQSLAILATPLLLQYPILTTPLIRLFR